MERTVPEAFPPLSWTRCGRRSLRPMLSTSLGRKRLLCHSGFILFLLPLIHHPHCSDALYLATRGSARVLDKEGELGLLEVGAVADFLLVDMQGDFPLFWLLCTVKAGKQELHTFDRVKQKASSYTQTSDFFRPREHEIVWTRISRGHRSQVRLSLR